MFIYKGLQRSDGYEAQRYTRDIATSADNDWNLAEVDDETYSAEVERNELYERTSRCELYDVCESYQGSTTTEGGVHTKAQYLESCQLKSSVRRVGQAQGRPIVKPTAEVKAEGA